jgi:hypothetical protein
LWAGHVLDSRGVSVLVIVLIVVGVLIVLGLVGGLLAAGRRDRTHAAEWEQHVTQADNALEDARAQDKGWDRALLEATARGAIERERPDHDYEDLMLVLVDDRPGVEQDRAHLVAAGPGGHVRVVLTRSADGDWVVERVE